MAIDSLSQKLACSADPRTSPDFCRQYFPAVNGKDVLGGLPPDRNDQIAIEFAASYYEINRQYARLLELRLLEPSAERQPRERAQMQRIEQALLARDGLEDRYAPYGVIVEPVMTDGFAVDLKCSFGNVDARGKPRSELVTITASLPVPLPAGAKWEDYLVRVEMPDSLPAVE